MTFLGLLRVLAFLGLLSFARFDGFLGFADLLSFLAFFLRAGRDGRALRRGFLREETLLAELRLGLRAGLAPRARAFVLRFFLGIGERKG